VAYRPLTAKDRRRVRELHAAGKSRNQIAREIGRSASTVSKLAVELGLDFDRSATAAATVARSTDLAARRVRLAEQLQDDAERLRAQLWESCKYGEFGGKDNVWSQVTLEQPRFGDQRQIIGAVQTAVNTSLRLQPAEGGEGAGEVRSMLGDLGAALVDAFGSEEGADDSGG
jgi:transposase